MKANKMKKFSAFLMIAALVAGCEPKNEIDNPSDKPVNGDPTQSVYMSIKVSLPSAGRLKSAGLKAEPGSEAGLDHENKVQKLLLVLADKDNNYGAHGLVEGMTTTGANLNVTAEFNQTNIGSFYDATTGKLKSEYNPVRVFVYCNPTDDLLTTINAYAAEGATSDSEWVDLACSLTDNTTIWGKNTFLMSNHAIAERDLPGSFAEWKSYYNKPESAFNLSGINVGEGVVDNSTSQSRGPIEVERSVARLDFRDASGNNNTYEIGKDEKLKVQLVKMGLANMSKSFYYLRHMSVDGLTNDADQLLMPEGANYVLDADATAKNTFWQSIKNPDYASLHDLFEYPLFNTDGKVDAANAKWDMYKISDVLANQEDNPDYTTTADYHIWRYVTENTLPGADAQVIGLSTSVVFKGKLLAGGKLPADESLAKALAGEYTLPGDLEKTDYVNNELGGNYPVLFVFQSNLYVGWNAGVKKCEEYLASQEGNTTTIYRAVQEVDALYDDWVTGTATLDEFRQAAAKVGFTMYLASNDDSEGGAGYYCYYFYKNRHRNNGETAMGPMEFATVRNNVYKLSVKSIAKIGYPGDPTDPLDPTDPDEDEELYITLDVRVLPWVVRENEIEF